MRVLELKVPPPIVALITAVLMWFISRSIPVFAFVFPARNAFAIGLVAAGFIIGILGVVTFRRAKTTVNPTNRNHPRPWLVGVFIGLPATRCTWVVF